MKCPAGSPRFIDARALSKHKRLMRAAPAPLNPKNMGNLGKHQNKQQNEFAGSLQRFVARELLPKVDAPKGSAQSR
jgi:hypothetical protein